MAESRYEAMHQRIENDGFRFGDVLTPGLLTKDQIASIPAESVFQWIKEGKWKMKHFQKWLDSFTELED